MPGGISEHLDSVLFRKMILNILSCLGLTAVGVSYVGPASYSTYLLFVICRLRVEIKGLGHT
ncbi:uncharacterized protein BDW47DRAFT_104570 [Aspergillus candidus]|uniref:Uncharacterized protein n=1 Tax=Aspergillus candidus TaxID=41067 RepID=A0A2I2FDB5_ASPCN|nr:hypothetical protein BDW47DRAFT_104570 [Aspergillus candidus]PLB38618.1 hypothetical protein BDW47DRAFT_104570 [Aspergillus candidus]